VNSSVWTSGVNHAAQEHKAELLKLMPPRLRRHDSLLQRGLPVSWTNGPVASKVDSVSVNLGGAPIATPPHSQFDAAGEAHLAYVIEPAPANVACNDCAADVPVPDDDSDDFDEFDIHRGVVSEGYHPGESRVDNDLVDMSQFGLSAAIVASTAQELTRVELARPIQSVEGQDVGALDAGACPQLSEEQKQLRKKELMTRTTCDGVCLCWHNALAGVAMAVAHLSTSCFWSDVRTALASHLGNNEGDGDLSRLDHSIEEIVCLCLGSLENRASKYQLALCLLLLSFLQVPPTKCFVFDPCHNKDDRAILAHFGFSLIEEDTRAKIRAQRMTLFYMPHAGYELTENLVQANLNALHHLAVLGNDFVWVVDSKAPGGQTSGPCRAPCVQAVLPLARVTDLPDTHMAEVQGQLRQLLPPDVHCQLEADVVQSLDCTLTTFPKHVAPLA